MSRSGDIKKVEITTPEPILGLASRLRKIDTELETLVVEDKFTAQVLRARADIQQAIVNLLGGGA